MLLLTRRGKMTYLKSLLIISILLLDLSCGGQKKPSDLTLSVPYNSNIWPDSKVSTQMDLSGLTNIIIIAAGTEEEIKKFYDSSYSNWESLTEWKVSKTSLSSSELLWKSWKKEDTYLLLSFNHRSDDKIVITHSFSNKASYENLISTK